MVNQLMTPGRGREVLNASTSGELFHPTCLRSEVDLFLDELRASCPRPRRVREKDSIDLGLALLPVCSRGEPLSCEDIAAWCDCSASYVGKIERQALKKLRVAFHYRERELCDQLRAEL